MVLFMVTLTLILEAQRSGRVQTLYWLPLMFALWANIHIQFIYGLFLLGLLLGINLLQRLTCELGVCSRLSIVAQRFQSKNWPLSLPSACWLPASGRTRFTCTK